MEKKKQILVVGDSGILGDRVVTQLIAQGITVKVSGKGWGDSLEFLNTDEARKGRSDQHMGLGGKQTATHDETGYMQHSDARLRDTSTGNYVSADKEDTSVQDIRKDESIRTASGSRGNAYKKASHDPDRKDKDPGGEFKHKEWEKDESSDKSQKKLGTSGAGQGNFATETGSFVGEYMSAYFPKGEAGDPEAGKEVPGYQTIMETIVETPYNTREDTTNLINPREHVEKGGAVDHDFNAAKGHSASTGSSDTREHMDKGRDMSTGNYKRLEGSLDKKEHMDSAYEGVDGVLFFGYSPTQDTSGSAKTLLDTAKEKGIGHVVYLSMQGASKKTGVRHLDAMNDTEQQLRNSGLSYTILRPSLYMEHFLSDKSLSSLREGHLDMPLSPDRPVDLVSAADVGRVVADVFQVPNKFHGKEIDLVADRVSMNEVASAMGQTFSKQVEYRKSEGSKDFQGSMNDHFQWMEKSDVHGDIKQSGEMLNRFNIQLTTFRDYLRTMKDKVSFDKAA